MSSICTSRDCVQSTDVLSEWLRGSVITLRLPSLRTLRLGSTFHGDFVDGYLEIYCERIKAIVALIPGEDALCTHFDIDITVCLSFKSDIYPTGNMNMQCLEHIAYMEREGFHVAVEKPDGADCIVSSKRALGLST